MRTTTASNLSKVIRDLRSVEYIDYDATVVVKIGPEWCEVTGVRPTGEHRNAVTFDVVTKRPDGGVIVVPPDL